MLVMLHLRDPIVVGTDHVVAAEHADDMAGGFRFDDGQVIDVFLGEAAQRRVKIVFRHDGKNRLGGDVGGHDERAGTVAGEDGPQIAQRKDAGQLFFLIDHWVIAVIRIRSQAKNLGEGHVFGDQIDFAVEVHHIADEHLFQDIDHKISLVGRAIDQAWNLLFVKTPAGREHRDIDNADQHQRDEQIVGAAHFADHQHGRERNPGDAGEKASHSHEHERLGMGDQVGKQLLTGHAKGPAEHCPDDKAKAQRHHRCRQRKW